MTQPVYPGEPTPPSKDQMEQGVVVENVVSQGIYVPQGGAVNGGSIVIPEAYVYGQTDSNGVKHAPMLVAYPPNYYPVILTQALKQDQLNQTLMANRTDAAGTYDTATLLSGDPTGQQGDYKYMGLFINVTAITGSVVYYVDTLCKDNVWYNVWASASISTTGQKTFALGPGMPNNVLLGLTSRLRWVVTTGPVTHSMNMILEN